MARAYNEESVTVSVTLVIIILIFSGIFNLAVSEFLYYQYKNTENTSFKENMLVGYILTKINFILCFTYTIYLILSWSIGA